MRSRLFVAIIATLFAIQSADAGNCAHVSSYQANYVQPVALVVDPYQQYVNVVARAFVVQTPFQSYTSVGDDARAYFSTKEAVKAGVREAILELQQQQQGNLQPGAGQGAAPAAQPGAIPQGAQKPWPQVMMTTFRTTCTKCHNPTENPERLNLSATTDLNAVDQRFYRDILEQRQDTLFRVMADTKSPEFMPKMGQRDDEFVDAAWASVAVAKAEAKAARKKPAVIPNPPVVPKEIPAVPKAPAPGPADKK